MSTVAGSLHVDQAALRTRLKNIFEKRWSRAEAEKALEALGINAHSLREDWKCCEILWSALGLRWFYKFQCCCTCELIKPLANFSPYARTNKPGSQRMCKACNTARHNAYYHAKGYPVMKKYVNKAKAAVYGKRYHARQAGKEGPPLP